MVHGVRLVDNRKLLVYSQRYSNNKEQSAIKDTHKIDTGLDDGVVDADSLRERLSMDADTFAKALEKLSIHGQTIEQ